MCGVSPIWLSLWRGSSGPRNSSLLGLPSSAKVGAPRCRPAAAPRNPSLSLRVLLFVSVLRAVRLDGGPSGRNSPPTPAPVPLPGKSRLESGDKRCMQDSERLAERLARAGARATSGVPPPHHLPSWSPASYRGSSHGAWQKQALACRGYFRDANHRYCMKRNGSYRSMAEQGILLASGPPCWPCAGA